ncbi:MAG: rhomboid family intramembrane serine protease [Calditrichaeota bacterium]|nr:rhomboid family intramembrane serine protease [Calditrichota bacterium]
MKYRNSYMGGARLGGMMTPGVKALLIANIAIYFLQMVNETGIIYFFGLRPAIFWSKLALWQPVTYMFLHGGFTHLLFNMLALWMFGSSLESVWGTKQFMKYYFLTGVGAALSNCILTPQMTIPIVGASGAVYGLLAAYAILFPNNQIYIWGLVPIRAKYLVLGFGIFEFIASLSPGSSPIAHLVHLGGMIIGVAYLKKDGLLRWGARKAKGVQRERKLKQVKKVEDSEDNLRQEVDDLLDKINEVGLENLTSWERRRLREASDLLKRMDEEKK